MIAERTPGSASVTFRHVFGPGTDEPLVWYAGPGTNDRRFLHADERGSIVSVTSDTGALLAINRYDEYGRTQTSGSFYGRFLYTGQRYFAGFGLYHYKNRIYDPGGGQFMQPDPIGYGVGMNLYAYVGGDPINWTDPLGLKKKCNRQTADNAPVVCGGESDGPVFSGGMAAALGGSSGNGSGGVEAGLIDGGMRDPDVTCLSEDCWDIQIAKPPGKKPFYFNGRRFVLDTRYVQPWYAPYVDYGFVVGPPLLAASVIAAPEALVAARIAAGTARAGAMSPTSKLFARGTGRLNSNNVLRIGQGWKGSALQGRAVLRVSIGHRTWPQVPGLPSFPWHVP